ncbi:MAG: hypothetical protein IT165_23640 [Bryobacterales bacterium]|nr:hypothetical protein [Bryobacterales bacterium]
MTAQPLTVVGEEELDRIDCRIIEYSYRPPASRITADGKTAVTLVGGKLWIGKTTQEWIKAEAYNELAGAKVTIVVTNPYRISPPLWVGKSWLFESSARMIPELAPCSTNRFRAEVLCQEDIIVPAGVFTTYKAGFELLAVDGVALDAPVLETVMWFTADTYCEIRRETYTTWKETEFAELAAAEGLREMGILRYHAPA